MKLSILAAMLFLSLGLFAQDLSLNTDTSIISKHSSRINGETVDYTAIAGTLPVWNDKGKAIASLFYTYYRRTNGKPAAERPIVFSFNGGPGSASVWMHLAYTGPKILKIDEEGYPIQPYGYKDNPYSILDVADIVFVDPVNTGYSRMIADEEGKMPDKKLFFGINADAKYLASWMNSFVSRVNRWESPKYIVGESYGGTRVMGLAKELQSNQWMYLNGVVLVSPADYKVLRGGNPIANALNLPYFTATAWHHQQLAEPLQSKDLEEILPEVEEYAINDFLPVLAKGSNASETEKNEVAERLAYYSGLDKSVILQHNLSVTNSYFWKELLRDENGMTIGRLDSRYLGIDKVEAGGRPDYNAELSSWLHSFTPAINHYLRNELNFKTDLKYNVFGNVQPWDYSNDQVREGLRKAMAENPYLNVMAQSGYYDGATTYFSAKYTLSQIDPSGKMKDRLFFKGYRSGHMMYLRETDLIRANTDLREFIKQSAANGKAAKYEK